MIATLRALFLARLLREKLLLVVFALSLGGRAGRLWREQKSTTLSLAQQTLWLSNRRNIEESATRAASRLDAARTLDGTRLVAEMTALANESGLRNTMSGEAQQESNGQFAVHTLQFTIQKADWDTLKSFYLALQQRSPYIGIEQFTLQSDRANPALLNAILKVSSVEIARD